MDRTMINQIEKFNNETVCIKGWLHRTRKLSKIAFIQLRDRTGLIQCVVSKDRFEQIKNLKLESILEIIGKVSESTNSTGNYEIQVDSLNILSAVTEDMPIEINTEDMNINIDTELNHRVLSLRNVKNKAIFEIQAQISESFRRFLTSRSFTEIFTSKIVAQGAEGGTALFKVKYFEKDAYLTQSPQFYKQMMVGAGFERVFEVAHVYRAEEHNTVRHLNEYVSMDLEMGFIKDETELIELETQFLKYMLLELKNNYSKQLELLGAELPVIEGKIPCLKLSDAINILKQEYGKNELENDLDPEGEKLISDYVKNKFDSDFVFLTHYPISKRPMYTMPLDTSVTRSFDLIFRGLEITTGGQRINDYNMLKQSMINKGLNPEDFSDYMNVFKYGMPPHGGLAIGLERITCQLLGYRNVRYGSLFPRDRTRVTP
ncbi:aspartate--tRNA(Asn) ligase [Clostridium oryzae]|uniref:Aspartate--tRNA ligase n=1 Tax=Clostridium oryzae TaxID=1450648 RepID=A0A1V4IV04_9CLOT|nr:aspartate--tRNA(Asn) ligase [Clostridium oryzae]OPJ63733.1 asparagine--tRNA ligase [Clostridium oryzae]